MLRLAEVEPPVPRDDEVLIKVHATTVTRTDCGMRSADVVISRLATGLLRPRRRILGMELAGVVEAVGAAVTEFEAGDRVFGIAGSGAHAEFVCLREGAALAHMPGGMTFDEAAALCDGAIITLCCLRHADVRTGRSILVYGASGAVGTAAVQLAKHFGADVTAVCNTDNVELVRSLGAGRVIDYQKEDFTKREETYDIIFDAVGKQSFRRCRRALKPGGRYIETDLGFLWHVPALALATRLVGDKKVTLGIARYTKKDVLFLKKLVEAGEFRPVIDRRYPLEDVVDATKYVETGQKTGNVVLVVSVTTRRDPLNHDVDAPLRPCALPRRTPARHACAARTAE